MKKLLALLTIIPLAILVVYPNITHAVGSVSYLSSSGTDVDSNSYTFSTAALGTAASDRRIVVIIGGDSGDGTEPTINSVTIGGVSASAITTKQNEGRDVVQMWMAAVPTGTTGDIVVTWDKTMRNMGLGWFRLVDFADFTPFNTNGTHLTSTSISTTINVPANGTVISGAHISSDNNTLTWSAPTERFKTSDEYVIVKTTGASDSIAEQTGYSTGLSWVGNNRAEITVASFGDAAVVASTVVKVPDIISFW